MHCVQVQTLSLVVVTFTYLLVGAAIFDALEGTNNENALEGLIKVGPVLRNRLEGTSSVSFVCAFLSIKNIKNEEF